MRKPNVDLAALRVLVARVYGRRAVEITRTKSGTTTQVYRLRTDAAVHYLRIAEDRPDRYGVEAFVHEHLRGKGVRVPAVVHYEPFDPALDRSILITTEIPGRPVSEIGDTSALPAVLRAAGRELALINSIPVSGFGFIDRSDPFPTGLSADFPNAVAFVEHDLGVDLATLRPDLPQAIRDSIRRAVQVWRSHLVEAPGVLAHGDFDGTHMYLDGDRYSGIIDFGEIRGADPLYDLGHFAILSGESLPEDALHHLLAGYREVTALSPDDLRRLWLWATLIGVRFLARTRGRAPASSTSHVVGRLAHALREQAR